MAETFTGDNGADVRLRAVSQRLVIELLAHFPIPTPPTYTVETVSGDRQTLTHDETTLQTDEDRAAWAAYLDAKAGAEMRRNLELHRFLLYQCILDEPPPWQEWGVDYALWGLEPPDSADKVAFKIRWVEEVIAPDPETMARLMLKLYQLSGMEVERLREIERFFRLALARQGSGGLDAKRAAAGEHDHPRLDRGH